MSRDEFVKAATEMYGNRYDFSLVTEENVKYETNAPIKCARHGVFFTTPYQMLHGIVGCFDCFKEEWWENENKGL